jgi:hypothetical protein
VEAKKATGVYFNSSDESANELNLTKGTSLEAERRKDIENFHLCGGGLFKPFDLHEHHWFVAPLY